MMEVVNGYPCFNCTDVALAKRNVDPTRPWDDPRNPNASNDQILHPTLPPRPPAVTFGGALSALSSSQAHHGQSNADASAPSRGGSLVDVTA
jgi:hypothetical protein